MKYANLGTEATRVLERHKVESYKRHWDPRAGILEIELPGFDLKYNVNHSTLMISGRSMKNPRAIPFKRWPYAVEHLERIGLNRAWWDKNGPFILSMIRLIESQGTEPPPAVENTAALDNEPAADPPADDLTRYQTIFNVTPRGVTRTV